MERFPLSSKCRWRALLLVVACGVVGGVYADTRAIGGLNLAVDEFVSVDDRSVKVRVGDVTRIVAKDRANDFIVEESFKLDAVRAQFSIDELKQFVTQSVTDGRAVQAKVGILALVRGLDSSAAFAEAFDNRFIDSYGEEGAQIVREVVHEPSISAIGRGTLLGLIGCIDAAPLRAELRSLLIIHSDEVKRFISARVIEALASRDFERFTRLNQKLSEIFGEDDAIVFRFTTVGIKLKRAIKGASTGDIERLLPILDLENSDAEVARALRPLVLDTLHVEATKAIAEKRYSQALGVLSYVGIERITPTSLDLVNQALQGVLDSGSSEFFSQSVDRLLVNLGEQNPSVRERYITLLAQQAIVAAHSGDFANSDAAFTRLLGVNPDPSSLNDSVRIQKALGLSRSGDSIRATREIDAISTSITLTQYGELFLAGYYVSIEWFIIAVFSPIAAALIMFGIPWIGRTWQGISLRRRKANEIDISQPLSGRATRGLDPQEMEEPPIFAQSVASRVGADPKYIEYLDCLAAFKLPREATYSEIKNAYRAAVKQAHPDAHKSSDASDAFIRLTSAYDRIQTLRKELQLKDD